jgi:DNA-binding CsgD family transcriptional regulator
VPRGLDATLFSLDADEYVIFSFPLAEVELPSGLTRAEREVVQALLDGRSNAEIARDRRTSVNTVANQLRAIYAKVKVSGRLELVRRCTSGGRVGSEE